MANQPKNFKIPTSFTLFGHKYRVEFVSDLYNSANAYGDIDDDTKVIRIQPPGTITKMMKEDGKEFPVEFVVSDETVLETFFHEMTHAILYSIEEDKLSGNEKFVGLMGKALLEIYLYAEYEETSKIQSGSADSSRTSVE